MPAPSRVLVADTTRTADLLFVWIVAVIVYVSM
jgi:hypothetical protein